MVSDGVAKSFEDCTWLYEALVSEKIDTPDINEAANYIVKTAVDNGADDDITAGVVRIGRRTHRP